MDKARPIAGLIFYSAPPLNPATIPSPPAFTHSREPRQLQQESAICAQIFPPETPVLFTKFTEDDKIYSSQFDLTN